MERLISALSKAHKVEKKIAILDLFLKKSCTLKFLSKKEHQLVYKALSAINQADHVFKGLSRARSKGKRLLDFLFEVEKFYAPIGGLVGYHHTFLKLLNQKKCSFPPGDFQYEKPEGIDLTKDSKDVLKSIRFGIEHMEELAEIYPVAGAGDRLDLRHEKTGAPLPAAQLKFLGKNLLEGLIRDLQGREYLYYKLMGKRIETPLVMMTSAEKNNDLHIKSILNKQNWFHRSPRSFFLMQQPLVPVITKEGLWALSKPLELIVKPGGHGVIWKLAIDSGAISWLKKLKRTKALIRQINNPIAGIDGGLLALGGIGCYFKKTFGFASCYRLLQASEGMDVLKERKIKNLYEYCITNVEYTEFESCGIQDAPLKSGSPYSKFPSNTNILFVDLNKVPKLLSKNPIPGMLINMKSQAVCYNKKGIKENIEVGRVESTMQNIADAIITRFSHKLTKAEKANLDTFVTYNHRHKTIAVTKKLQSEGNSLQETPESAFYELQCNAQELFALHCGFLLPKMPTKEQYLKKGPSFILLYHPALGPLYSVIAQKVRQGKLHKGAELHLEIAEVDLSNLNLKGSLFIQAIQVMGHFDKKKLIYSENSGKCILENVKVSNKGINFKAKNQYWKQEIARQESLHIQLEGNAEFVARNVLFRGNHKIRVPTNHRMTVTQVKGNLLFELEKISTPSWSWNYSFLKDDRIALKAHLTQTE